MEKMSGDCSASPTPWRKNLYSNVGYDDNYTDITFLQQLKRNPYTNNTKFKDAVLSAGRVTERICLIFVFIVVYQWLVNLGFSPVIVFVRLSVIVSACYLWYLKLITTKNSKSVLTTHGRTVVLFIILGFILSPVLKTLTESISTDTIYATTFFMMIIHVTFFDYKVPAAIVSSALSTNAAIFGSLCLASRLHSSFHAFVLLTSSVECFVLYPPFSLALYPQMTYLFLFTLIIVTTLLVASVSSQACLVFVSLVFFINGVCPILFVKCQKYKNNIYGPWDEAVIKKYS